MKIMLAVIITFLYFLLFMSRSDVRPGPTKTVEIHHVYMVEEIGEPVTNHVGHLDEIFLERAGL